MIILNSFVTPLSVRRETLQKKFPFSSPFFMFWGVCTFSSNCCFVSCVVFCIVVLHIVTCVLFAIVVLHVVTCVVFCIVVLHVVTCVVFCIVVLHIVTCVLPPVYLELWNFSEEFVDVSQSASSGILQYSGNFIFFLTQWNIEAILQYCWEYFFFTSTTGLWETSRNHRAPLAAVSPHCQSDQAGKSYFQSTSKNKKS